MNILSGDIGGTKTLLLLSHVDNAGRITEIRRKRFDSSEFNTFYELVETFLAIHQQQQISSACFGVAGPVVSQDGFYTSRVTNLPWTLDSNELSHRCNIPNVVLVNDFRSIGFGLSALQQNDYITLQEGSPVDNATQLIVGAGTGLGVAQLVSTGGHTSVFATEAGHGNFAPANEIQMELAQYLLKTFGTTSLEFVLSGPGLANVYKYINQRNNTTDSPEYHRNIASIDPAASIFSAASKEGDPSAIEALELFVECYGSQAGNLALSTLAQGGVYIAGGIAPKIIEWLKKDSFLSAFSDKSKMSTLLKEIPIKVVMNPEVGLLGSQVVAAQNTIKQ